VPSRVFPRSLVCPICRRVAVADEFEWVDEGGYICKSDQCASRRPRAFPARFILACRRGHIDDFAWRDFVHRGPSPCGATIRVKDRGLTGAISDVVVECDDKEHPARSIGEAFDVSQRPPCSGAQPWLGAGRSEPGCNARMRALLRGASN